MMLSSAILPFATALLISVSAMPLNVKRGVDPALVPQFGHAAGVNPTGTGNCDGAVNGSDGKPIEVPCACPPDRDTFIVDLNANVAAGHAINNPTVGVSFPTDNSKNSQLARLNAAAVTLQNLNGPGKGCPVSSTTFSAQQQAIENGSSPPAASTSVESPPPPAKSASASAKSTPVAALPLVTPPATPPAPSLASGVDPSLVPQFGHAAGVNPTGTGNCDGAVNGSDGKPIEVPCACPPDRDTFIADLNANVAAGHAVNNPTVKVSFPTDNSKNSQLARLNAAAVTLQNLNGPGKGCPVSSTSFSAQQQAIENSSAAPAPASIVSSPAAPISSPAPAVSSSAPTKSTLATALPPVVSGGVDPSLVPQFGHAAGINPTGTGNCDGAVNNSNGKPIQVPCSCPPDRDTFIADLNANVAAGHAVNNPNVQVSFPTDNSKSSQAARIEAAIVTLQNLNGPGKGCPAASTTFSAQLAAVQ